MTLHGKTLRLIDAARAVLQEHRPMTLRQTYYQLVSRQIISNTMKEYGRLGRALVRARQEGLIEWGWLEDRTRQPREVSMWSDLESFTETALQSFRLDTWETQPVYFEAWLEKEALSDIFAQALRRYGVTLNVGRGYDGWSSIHAAAERFALYANHRPVEILYFGDLDPSGDDMPRSLEERIAFFGVKVPVTKCALKLAHVEEYDLPPDPAKRSDTRSKAFIAKHGDVSVELDAMPPQLLRDHVTGEVLTRMDLRALVQVEMETKAERTRLTEALCSIGD